MRPLRFIHAADTHLDAAFIGLASLAQDMSTLLHSATFTAFERLFSLCLAERPDFLILAGDITNAEDSSLKAQFALHDGCVRLAAANIPVFIAYGNHDSLKSPLHSLQWPDTVTFFGSEVSTVPVRNADGELIAMVHGVSHASANEKRNLAKDFKRGDALCPHIGILHTSLGEADGIKRYAPCTLEDLQIAGMDYWALGHIHKRQVVCEKPPIIYSGCTQGLHVHEEGEKGCLLVSLMPETFGGASISAPSYVCEKQFHVLGPVVWRILDVPVRIDDTLDALGERIQKQLAEAGENIAPYCDTIIARVRLTGRTELDSELCQQDTLDVLTEHCNALYNATQRVWLKDIQGHTQAVVDREALRKRPDLSGEISRLVDVWQHDQGSLEACREQLKDVFRHKTLRKMLEPLSDEALRAVIVDAETLCLDAMEKP